MGEAGEVAREATPPTNPQTLHSFRCLIVTFQASCVKTPFNFILSDAHPSCLVQETRISPLISLQLLRMCTFVMLLIACKFYVSRQFLSLFVFFVSARQYPLICPDLSWRQTLFLLCIEHYFENEKIW